MGGKGWLGIGGDAALALLEARTAGIPMPDARLGVGKRIGDCLWLHRSVAHLLREPWREAEAALPCGFVWDVLRWRADGEAAFIRSADFDTAAEPTVGESAKIYGGQLRVTRPPADPLIYHHKWSFVLPGHGGFDTLASLRRSLAWRRVVGRDRAVSSRIGRRGYWEDRVLPRLAEQEG